MSTSTASRVLQRLVDLGFDAVFATVQNRVVDAHFDRRIDVFVGGGLGCVARALLLEVLDQTLQRVRSAIEHEIVAQFALFARRSRRTA